MIKPYEEFIEETKAEYPDFFEAMGEAYFKELYDSQVQIEKDYKRVKEAFTTTQIDQKIADLSNVGIDDTKTLIDHAHLFGNTLTMMLSNDYDAIYACPEVAAFMQLSPYFHRPKEIKPSGIYKFGQFGTETFMVDCYKAPNEVAEKDCVLLHKRTDEWLKLEVKISEYYERKYKAEQKKSKETLYFDRGIDFSKKSKSAIYEECEVKPVAEVYWTKENNAIREAMKKVLNFMEEQSKACSNEDIESIVAWDTLQADFYEEFFSSGRYNDWGKEKK